MQETERDTRVEALRAGDQMRYYGEWFDVVRIQSTDRKTSVAVTLDRPMGNPVEMVNLAGETIHHQPYLTVSGAGVNIAYVGNFTPPHSTENEVRKALEALGHDVTCVQEGERQSWLDLSVTTHHYDVILWTRTADLAKRISHAEQHALLLRARQTITPTVAFHLDRWWGLREHGREDSVWTEPFFRCQYFFSTDGAHDTEWATVGVNHHWMPPGVSEFECVPGTPRDEWRSDIGFIGSHRGYHGEHPHRQQLVSWLRDTYGDRVRFWPEPGQPAVRGDDLRDLIASVKVWVGDSCLAPRADGGPMVRYWSDRVPEVTGRGGFLLHPFVEGMTQHHPHVNTWPMGDWDLLREHIDRWVENDGEREMRAADQRSETLVHHTYSVRMAQVLEAVCPS